MRYTKLFILLLTFNALRAQLGKEAWNWHFGINASVNFSSGVPVTGTSAMHTREGSASISDLTNGQTLFYSDGDSVWNKNNALMPNGFGLKGGNLSSTQAALIVPKPNHSSIYFLFTSDQGGYDGPNSGVHYSIVDMSLNGGLGDVTTKNTLLTPAPTTEKLTAVKHCNGTDYWVITHPFNSNAFHAYLVSSSGVNPTPVISHAGKIESSISGSNLETIGYLKASPNGKKLALGIAINDSLIELFDFDASSGTVNNPIAIHLNQGAYGVAFSPNSKLLYTTYSEGMGNLDQFDISSGVGAIIQASKTTLATDNYLGAMQIAPNGKIYITKFYTSYLDVINNPDAIGVACNYQDSVINLSPNKGWYGLPNFIDANFEVPLVSNFIATPLCSLNTHTLIATNGMSDFIWSNGDTTKNTSISTVGNYWVSYINQNNCRQIDTFEVTVEPSPIINLGNDITSCAETLLLSAYNPSCTYTWNTGETVPEITVSNPGLYWVEVTNQFGCDHSDTIEVNFQSNTSELIIPNIVTPNGDGINDYIDFGKYESSIFYIEVYNRWGLKVFDCSGSPCIWNPKESDGTYFYTAQYTDVCDDVAKTKKLKGHITILK